MASRPTNMTTDSKAAIVSNTTESTDSGSEESPVVNHQLNQDKWPSISAAGETKSSKCQGNEETSEGSEEFTPTVVTIDVDTGRKSMAGTSSTSNGGISAEEPAFESASGGEENPGTKKNRKCKQEFVIYFH